MECRDIISALAILISPAIAVVISLWIQRRRDILQQKRFIFSNLMATRHHFLSDDVLRSLNLIDVVFHDNKSVRQLWKEYMEMVNNPGLNNEQGDRQRRKKNLELVQEMAKAVGYGEQISHLDVDRFYFPVGFANERKRASDIADEVLRVLRESHGIKVIQKEEAEREERQPKG